MQSQRGAHRLRLRGRQDALAGVVVVLFAAVALLALSRMSEASYSTFSPALFPSVCAWGLMIGGIGLVARGFLKDGPGLERLPLRPALLVTLAVFVFGLVTPVAGYAVSGLLTVVIGGLATPDVRLREIAVVAVALIAFSVGLFSFVLKLSIPILILPGVSF
jgi:hypothetical protein